MLVTGFGTNTRVGDQVKMRNKKPFLAILLLTLMICAAPTLALFGQSTKTFKGRINFLQETNFTLMIGNSELIRVMVPQSRPVPSEVQLGVKVEVKVIKGRDGFWYLDKFKKIGLATPAEPQ